MGRKGGSPRRCSPRCRRTGSRQPPPCEAALAPPVCCPRAYCPQQAAGTTPPSRQATHPSRQGRLRRCTSQTNRLTGWGMQHQRTVAVVSICGHHASSATMRSFHTHVAAHLLPSAAAAVRGSCVERHVVVHPYGARRHGERRRLAQLRARSGDPVRRGRFAGTYDTLDCVISRHGAESHMRGSMHPASRGPSQPPLSAFIGVAAEAPGEAARSHAP